MDLFLGARVVKQIQQMSGQEYVPEYAQVVKKQMQEEQRTLDAARAEEQTR